MSAEELEAALKEIIAEVGATSGKDMGKVMGVASKKLAGLAEGRAISAKSKKSCWDKRNTLPLSYKRASTEGLSVQSLLNIGFLHTNPYPPPQEIIRYLSTHYIYRPFTIRCKAVT